MKKHLAIVLSAALILGLTACNSGSTTDTSSESTENTTDITTEASDSSQIDPEVQRGVTLGLVNADYLEDPTVPATTADLEDMGAKILELRGAEASVLTKWSYRTKCVDKNRLQP